jgi:hypothetical protein
LVIWALAFKADASTITMPAMAAVFRDTAEFSLANVGFEVRIGFEFER